LKKIIEFDLIEIGIKGKKTLIAKGTLNLSLYIKGDPSIRFPLALKNKKLGDSPICVISVSTKFVKLNHMAMIPADSITSGDQIVSIDRRNYQLRHADEMSETSIDTEKKTDDDDPTSEAFDDEEHTIMITELKKKLEITEKLSIDRLSIIKQLEDTISKLRDGKNYVQENEKTIAIEDLIKENEIITKRLQQEQTKNKPQSDMNNSQTEELIAKQSEQLLNAKKQIQKLTEALGEKEKIIQSLNSDMTALKVQKKPGALFSPKGGIQNNIYIPLTILMVVFAIYVIVFKR